ncbi:MAG: hypothetical protein Q9222_003283 [Ikaeria aurantiellina]
MADHACTRNNATCEYFDTAKGKRISRDYVVHLQNKIKALELKYSRLEPQQSVSVDVEDMVRSGGLVALRENAETRFLGPSSGIAMTRLVMELAKRQTQSRSIQDIVSDSKVRQIRDRSTLELAKPTSKVYPLVSSVAAPDLPSRDLTEKLVELFNRKAQYMLPTLHEPSFHSIVDNVYNGSSDSYENFVLRMVLSISMQKLDSQYAGLADSYYLAAMPHLEQSVKQRDLGTLQCLTLIAQYSMVTPTRAASYWVVGLASKLCQALGWTDDRTIELPDSRIGEAPSALEIDMRRRLFWIVLSMETGLAHSLGRPSAFACTYDQVDVRFFEPVNDEYIRKGGIVPGCPNSMKKRVAIHFLSMRLLQLEIRRKLYLVKRTLPDDDRNQWFGLMEQKLRSWLDASPREDGGSGLDQVWFKGRFNTMIIFLYRPSPQVPDPSLAAARTCFDACTFNIRMHRNQVATKSVDLSWIWTQSTFMVLNTILWALSYPEVRRENSKAVVENCISQAQECIAAASSIWPGVEAAMELYETLISACLRAYDAPEIPSVVIKPEVNETTSPTTSHRNASQPLASSPSTMVSSYDSPQSSENAAPPSPSSFVAHRDSLRPATLSDQPGQLAAAYDFDARNAEFPKMAWQPMYSGPPFASHPPNYPKQLPLPSLQDTAPYFAQQAQVDFTTPLSSYENYFALMGDPYLQDFQPPGLRQPSFSSLSQEEQCELMRNLESESVAYSWRFP